MRASKQKRHVVGLHACREVQIVRPETIEEVWLKTGYESSEELKGWAAFAKKARIQMKVMGLSSLDKVASGHQGLCLTVSGQPEFDWDQLKAENKKIALMALDQIEDPHNLGAILRSAWLLGVTALIIPERRSVHLTASVAKVACGGAEHVPILAVTQLPETLKSLKEDGFWVFGLDGNAQKDIWSLEMPQKVVWVVGSEESGLRSTTKKQCDETVRLFQVTRDASLNASVASAIALAETVRQWNRN